MTADMEPYIRAVLMLMLVIGLVFAAAWVARRFSLGGAQPLSRKPRRLAVSEILPVDARHRLILVRRDSIEHLVLIGGTNPIVVETGIRSGAAATGGETES